jgi:hypothetical protein
MKYSFLIFCLFLIGGTVRATEKLWVPLGLPDGQTVDAQSRPNAQGTAVLVPNPTPHPTETVVPGIRIKDGHWVYKYIDKTPESEGDYAGGNKDGVWKYYRPDGSECREIEFKEGQMTGGALLWSPGGSQKYFDHLTDVIQKAVPSDFKVKTLLPYWVDLLGDGDHQILAIARSDSSSMVLVLDLNGNLLDSKVFSGFVDDFTFGEIKKGGDICFGYDISCDAALGVCQWEFDIWDGTKIKTVLEYEGWYGKTNPFTMPVFQDLQGQTGIVTDNGTFQWDDTKQSFKKVSN